MENYIINELSEAQFNDFRDKWTDLISKANCDQLFLSWEWINTWWSVFGNPKTDKLKIITVTDINNQLVGIAPLFITKTLTKKIINSRRLQFLGNYWHGKVTMRSELLEFIVSPTNTDSIILSILKYIFSSDEWDEIVFSELRIESDTYRLFTKSKYFKNCYSRNHDSFNSYYLPTTGQFDEYLNSLGKNTRLKLYNRRKLLNTLGDVHFETGINNEINIRLEQLNQLHEKRWGNPVFSNKRLAFNRIIATLMSSNNQLSFSVLTIDKNIVSIQFNYNIKGHIYNIQAGFDESVHKKIALGYLHFGFEIENTFNSGYKVYDFLAGNGKNSPYKKHLTKESVNITTLQYIRSPILRLLYKTYDTLSKSGN